MHLKETIHMHLSVFVKSWYIEILWQEDGMEALKGLMNDLIPDECKNVLLCGLMISEVFFPLCKMLEW